MIRKGAKGTTMMLSNKKDLRVAYRLSSAKYLQRSQFIDEIRQKIKKHHLPLERLKDTEIGRESWDAYSSEDCPPEVRDQATTHIANHILSKHLAIQNGLTRLIDKGNPREVKDARKINMKIVLTHSPQNATMQQVALWHKIQRGKNEEWFYTN